MSETPTKFITASDGEQMELFIACFADVNTKGDITSMEYPLFSLSTRLDTEIYRFENPATGAWLEIIPSAKGRATIFDKDLLLYTISQLVEAENSGIKTSRRVQIVAHDFLKATGRKTDGKSYKALHDMLARLRGTTFKAQIEKNSQSGGYRKGSVFGLIDDAVINETNGRMTSIEITLSKQLLEAIDKRQVLTYDKAYFDLRSPMARRLYEIARKFCGNQPIWEISLAKLYDRMGGRSSMKEFRRAMKRLVEQDPLPGYELDYETASPRHNKSEKIIVMPILKK